MNKEVAILIGIRWNNSSTEVICRETERFLTWLSHTQFGNMVPVHWNIPCHPFLEIRSGNLENLIHEIKTRIKKNGDIPIPMGFSGNAHPLLSLSELEKECEWCISNPWESGIEDTFNIIPHVIIPTFADVQRKEAIDCYRKMGFHTIGFPQIHLAYSPYAHIDSNRYKINTFSFITLCPEVINELKRGIKKYIEEQSFTLFFFFDCSFIDETVTIPFSFEPFTELIEEVMTKYKVRFTSITSTNRFSPCKSDELFHIQEKKSFPTCPLWRKNAQEVKNDRNLTLKTSRIYKDILRGLSPFNLENVLKKRVQTGKKALFPPKERINDTNMQGNAILYGDAFSVTFLEGKIIHFKINNTNASIGKKSRSFISVSGKNYYFQNLSAFSILGERSRGLREAQLIPIDENSEPGVQLTDYYFVDDFPYLLITSKITYPFFQPGTVLKHISPFELPLIHYTKNDSITIHAQSAYSVSSLSVPYENRIIILAGDFFCISAKNYCIVIGFPVEKGAGSQFMEFSVEERKKDYCLKANPFGTYLQAPSEWYSKITELFTFYIGVNTMIPEAPPVFPATVLNEIPLDSVYFNPER
jgi:hypothetical protein